MSELTRHSAARLAEMLAANRQADASAQMLTGALRGAPPGFACWTIPIEPAFRHAVSLPAFAPLLHELAVRAR